MLQATFQLQFRDIRSGIKAKKIAESSGHRSRIELMERWIEGIDDTPPGVDIGDFGSEKGYVSYQNWLSTSGLGRDGAGTTDIVEAGARIGLWISPNAIASLAGMPAELINYLNERFNIVPGDPMQALGALGTELQWMATVGRLSAAESAGARTLTETQLEFPFARGAAVQTPGVTVEGETFVRVGARPWNLKFGATPGGAQPGTYAFPQATFETIGENPAALKNFGDLPGAAPQYFRTLSPPAGTLIQRGIVPGGEFGGVGGVPEVIFTKGF